MRTSTHNKIVFTYLLRIPYTHTFFSWDFPFNSDTLYQLILPKNISFSFLPFTAPTAALLGYHVLLATIKCSKFTLYEIYTIHNKHAWKWFSWAQKKQNKLEVRWILNDETIFDLTFLLPSYSLWVTIFLATFFTIHKITPSDIYKHNFLHHKF